MRPSAFLDDVEENVEAAGFIVSERCTARPSCFDLAARREDKVVLFKCTSNLTSVSKEKASELRLIAQYLSATPLIMSERTSKSLMGDDAVYIRHGVQAITPQTLVDAIVHGRLPLVEAKPGGFYVQLDEDAIRGRRLEMRLSLGQVASMIGVSRRTVYGYERGLTRASVEAALRLEATLGVPAVVPIDLFKETAKRKKAIFKRTDPVNEALGHVVDKFSRLGFQVACTKMAPFDFIAWKSDGKRIIGGFTEKREERAEKRVQETVSVANVTMCQTVFIGKDMETTSNEASMVRYEEFLEIQGIEGLCDLLA